MNPGEREQPPWVPHAEVSESNAGLLILVELAGMRREAVELTHEGGRLWIKGDRAHPSLADRRRRTKLTKEVHFGYFEILFEVPPGYELKSAKAHYQNGFLHIEVPRRE